MKIFASWIAATIVVLSLPATGNGQGRTPPVPSWTHIYKLEATKISRPREDLETGRLALFEVKLHYEMRDNLDRFLINYLGARAFQVDRQLIQVDGSDQIMIHVRGGNQLVARPKRDYVIMNRPEPEAVSLFSDPNQQTAAVVNRALPPFREIPTVSAVTVCRKVNADQNWSSDQSSDDADNCDTSVLLTLQGQINVFLDDLQFPTEQTPGAVRNLPKSFDVRLQLFAEVYDTHQDGIDPDLWVGEFFAPAWKTLTVAEGGLVLSTEELTRRHQELDRVRKVRKATP
ncbi:MAG: hypothetical protein V1495_03640 [Pseudomonadota bacterium]